MKRLLAVAGVLAMACDPTGPPMPFADSGFRLLLDTALDDTDPCRPRIDASAQIITAAQVLDGPGPFFVCPTVPFTATGDGADIYVSEYASATVNGNDTVTWALVGAQVHSSGERAVIIAEPQALVSVAQSSSGIAYCEDIFWPETWTSACP